MAQMFSGLRAFSGLLLILPGVACAAEAADAANTSPSVARLIVGLFVVLGVIFASAWFLRRLPGVGRGGVIRVLAATPVGTRERVALIACGDKQFLVGVTAQQISLLHTYDEAVASDVPAPSHPFAEQLARVLRPKGPV